MTQILTVIDVVDATPQSLRPYTTDANRVIILARPLVGFAWDEWKSAPRMLPGFETAAIDFLERLQPLFRSAERDEGPHAIHSEIGLLACVDYFVFAQGRFSWGLMQEMQAVAAERKIALIELVTDSWHGGRCLAGVKAFARSASLPWAIRFNGGGAKRIKYFALQLRNFARRACFIVPKLNGGKRSRQIGSPGIACSESSQSAPNPVIPLRVAMLVSHAKSWRYLLPLRTALMDRGHFVLLLSPNASASAPLVEAGLPFYSIPRSFLTRKRRVQMNNFLNCIVHDSPGASADEVRSPEARQLGQLVTALTDDIVVEYASIAGHLPEIFRCNRINCIMGTDSGSVAGRAFFRTAEAMAIRSLFVQHGAFAKEPGVAEYFTRSHKLVWGTTSADILRWARVPFEDRIVVMGSPFVEEQMDSLQNKSLCSSNEFNGCILVAFGVPGNTVSEVSFKAAACEVLHAAASHPEQQFVIKPHPGDRSATWDHLLKENPCSNVDIQRGGNSYLLVANCRVLLTMLSTMGAEAAYLGKPVVSVNLDGIEWGVDYVDKEAAYVASQPGDLASILDRVLNCRIGQDPLAGARREYADAFLYRTAQTASDRIVDWLESSAADQMSPVHA